MFLSSNDKPIYLQLAEMLEDNILKGIYPEESKIPSKIDISVAFNINPATASKGVNVLVSEDIIYKKRGLGMFVCTGAKEKIMTKRKEAFYNDYVLSLMSEAKKLNISQEDIIKMIERGNKND